MSEEYPILVRVPLVRAGKIPLVHRWSTLPPDSSVWRDTFAEHPGCNVGIRLDGLLVVDCDSPEAVEWWTAMDMPTQVRSQGRRDRMCFWYRYDGDAVRPGKLRHDVDLKLGPGHQVVVPPSIHPTGVPYRWADVPLCEETLVYLGEVDSEMLHELRSAAPVGSQEGGWDVIETGGRDDFLIAVGGLLRAKGMGVEGIRRALAAVNQVVCHPPKSAGDIERIATSASRYDPDVEMVMEDEGPPLIDRRPRYR